jgi:GAF domain-containing protein
VEAPGAPASLRSWLTALGELTRATNEAAPFELLLTRVAQQACALIGFDCCAVLLAEDEGERLRVAGSAGLTADYVALVTDEGSPLVHPPDPALDTPAARAFRERRTVAVPDALADRRHGRLRALAQLQGYRALLAVPLGTPAEQSGVIVGYSTVPREFDPAEQELVGLLSDQAALALENTRLRSAQQQAIGELSRANEELRRGRAVQEWAERQHHALMELTLADVGLEGLVTALAETLRAAVTVEDPEGHVLARAPDRDHRARRRPRSDGACPSGERWKTRRAAMPSCGCRRAGAGVPARQRWAIRPRPNRGRGWRPWCSVASSPGACGWSIRGSVPRRWSAA